MAKPTLELSGRPAVDRLAPHLLAGDGHCEEEQNYACHVVVEAANCPVRLFSDAFSPFFSSFARNSPIHPVVVGNLLNRRQEVVRFRQEQHYRRKSVCFCSFCCCSLPDFRKFSRYGRRRGVQRVVAIYAKLSSLSSPHFTPQYHIEKNQRSLRAGVAVQ